MRVPDEFLEEAVLRLTHECEPGESICPSEVARAVAARTGGMWKAYLPDVRKAAMNMAKRNLVSILRDGKRADPDTFRGLYRIGLYDPELEDHTPEPPSLPVTTAIIAAAQSPAADTAPEPVREPAPVAIRHHDVTPPAREIDIAASLQITAALEVVLTLEDLTGDADETDYVDLPPLVLDEDDPPEGVEPVPADEDDDDPDLHRAPQAATLDDIARGLERYLTSEPDDASRGETQTDDDVIGPPDADEKPALPDWQAAFRRYLETPDEE